MGLGRTFRLGACGVAVTAAGVLAASPAVGAVTIGQVGPPELGLSACEGYDLVQESVTQGNTYVVPGNGTITQWTTYAGSPGTLKLKIFRLIAAPATYQAVGHAGPQSVTGSGTAGNTFPANIPVQAGDLLGVTGTSKCVFSTTGGRRLQYVGDLADGASAPFTTPATGRLNVQATFVPDNSFSVARTARNKKKGTATLILDLPNPGQLTGRGKDAKVTATSPKPQGSVPSPGSGPSQLVVRAKGGKLAQLEETGKVKLRLTVTYTPTGGDPKTQSLNVRLRKNR